MGHKISLHNHAHPPLLLGEEEYDNTIVKKLVKNSFAHNFNGIAFTDMDSERKWREVLESKGKIIGEKYFLEKNLEDRIIILQDNETGKKLRIIKGIEMHGKNTLADRHLLAVGHKGSLEGKYQGLNLRERLLLAREQDALIIAPHPLFLWGIGDGALGKFFKEGLIDATEFNAQVRFSYKGNKLKSLIECFFDKSKCNTSAEKISKKLNIPYIASPDSNSGQVHLAYTIFHADPNREERENGQLYLDYLKRELTKKEKGFDIKKGYINLLDFTKDYSRAIIDFLKREGK